jgi:glycosyltransferase involved in cell wall biosynthesis
MNKPYSVLDGERPDIVIDLHDGTDEAVSIIVVHKDRPEYLNICLQTIAVTSVNNNYEIIVVDNGSTRQDALDYLDAVEKEPNIKVIRNATNKWWSAAANIGAKAADSNSKYLIFLHHDVNIINPAWIDLLINIAEAQGSGCLGLESAEYEFDGRKMPFIQEWCMMVSKECWKDCGPFLEELPQMGAPFMFTNAASTKGYKPQLVKKIPLAHHYKTFAMDHSEYERFSEHAKAILPKLLMDLQKKR